jgi:hypothetical protein
MKNRIEVRTCIKCGEEKEIVQRHKYATNTCADCQREASRIYQREEAIREGRRIGLIGRIPYPLEPKWKHMNDMFRARAKKMKGIEDREDWINQIRINLEEAFNKKEVMEWIYAHNDDEPTTKKQSKINIDLPDTRNMTWDEYERGLGEEDVDS